MRVRLLALFLISVTVWAQAPRLLLTAQRLKRLERDRERQTERWANFERRVQSVPDSPQRGWELALYAVVTGDAQRDKEAVAWALAHPCERRQAALIVNWLRDVPDETVRQIAAATCPQTGLPLERLRDDFFTAVMKRQDPPAREALPDLTSVPGPEDLYALAEYVEGFRTTQFSDLRRSDTGFYSTLPEAYLLSLHPDELARPTRQQHIAALALVALDPNLESSQFLQGWALEERFVVREGPGVADELFWANPYLPGIGYQNMDPWLYRPDNGGTLLARTGWEQDSCWVRISGGKQEQLNCPADWQSSPTAFGHLTLLPLESECIKVEPTPKQRQQMLRTAQPHTGLRYTSDGERRTGETDASGLWMVPNDVSGNICQEKRDTTHARRH